jgi:hypothetical protein
LLSGANALDSSGKLMAATGTGQFTKMISDLDGFTFAEMPSEYEKELDKEEAESDEPE